MTLNQYRRGRARVGRFVGVVGLAVGTFSAMVLGVATQPAQAAAAGAGGSAAMSRLDRPWPTPSPVARPTGEPPFSAGEAARRAMRGWNQVKEINGSGVDLFGWSVAISGHTMVIGAPDDNSGIGAAYVYTGSGSNWTQEAELTPEGGVGGDFFGGAVAVSADAIVVGAPGRDNYEGIAYVFSYRGSGMTFAAAQQAVLTDPGGAGDDYFGDTLAISGLSIAIGASGENANEGAVYVYTLDGGTWIRQATLPDPGGVAGDSFGWSVAFQSSTLVVGAPGVAGALPSNMGEAFTGAAYVFKEIGGRLGTWTDQAELTASNGRGCVSTCSQPYDLIYGDYFGYSVAVKGTAIAVGAAFASFPTPATDGSGNGSVYAFTESGGTWEQKQELYDPAEDTTGSPATGDWFGYNVAFLGRSIVANAPGDPQGFESDIATGASFVFPMSRGVWATYPTELSAQDGGPGDYFGYGLTTSGNKYVVVGAPYTYVPPSYSEDGGVYVFKN